MMVVQQVVPQQLQKVGGPSQAYTPTTPAPITVAGGDQIVLRPPAGQSLRAERTFVIVSNSDTAGHTVSVPAGDLVLGVAQQRPSTFYAAAGQRTYVGPFDSSIVTQKDGSIIFNLEAGHAGTFEAYTLPKGS